MGGEERNLHYVCTYEEAEGLIASAPGFWVSNCGCRVERGGCARSRIDVCLGFSPGSTSDSAGARPIARETADEIMGQAREKRLVARPYRDFATRTDTEGICLCCDDCCGYFLNPQEACDPGAFIEVTAPGECNHCLECVDVCHFHARDSRDGELVLDRTRCYGCGLCVGVCPAQAISMASRG